ncbi:MAG: (Fe-S)-binding protein [Sedimentisphaerales bacterium]|nr:(Fe-S)-binding protein [Sedimentisphaerales bacterium]
MICATFIGDLQAALPAGLLLLGVGGTLAVALLFAHQTLRVEQDPRVEAIYQVLPHLDCGACGYAGCSSYAKAVLADPTLIGRCSPGGPAVAQRLAAILSVESAGSSHPIRAVVHCNAHTMDKTYYGNYEGIASCIAGNTLTSAQACRFGCLGMGDCVRACRFDAIHMVDGLATVDYQRCTGCGACAKVCPRGIIEMVTFQQSMMMVVACNSKEDGRTTRAMCKAGCIGCGLCAKQSDIFVVSDNLSKIDYSHYRHDEGTDQAMAKCPTKVIIWRGC